MLTVKAPIELKCQTGMVSSWEGFYHRIRGNYEMISMGIDREDLLHVVAAPPEVYIGEGGMTSLVNQTSIQNSQETKLEVINNLLNRVALTENVDLTYQDRVYITDVLKKLGIQNVSQFMSQVARMKQETRTTEQLISLYWNHLEELTQLVEEYRHEEKTSEAVTENVRNQQEIHLHEDIMNRLQTGALYQILHNFYSSYNGSSQYMASQELQITEQKRVASNILLNQLKNVVQSQKVPFVYRHQNYYETVDLEESQITSQAVSTQITSAVLLNLIDNLYFSWFERQRGEGQTWLNIENALYQTADNTLWRMKNETSNQFLTRDRKEMLSEYQRQVYEQEVQAIYQLLTLSREVPGLTGREGTGMFFQEPATEKEYRQADIRYPEIPEEWEENAVSEERESRLFREYQLRLERQVERYMEAANFWWPGQGRREQQESVPMAVEKTFGEEEQRRLPDGNRETELLQSFGREGEGPEPVSLYHGPAAGLEEENQEQGPENGRQPEDRLIDRETHRILSEYQTQVEKIQPMIYRQEQESRLLTETYESTLGQESPQQPEFSQAELHIHQGDENITAVEETQRFLAEYENRISREQSKVYHTQERQNQLLTETYESPLRQETQETTQVNGAEVSVYRQQEDEGTGDVTRENQVQQTFVRQEENVEQIEKQLKQINQQNIENYNRYQEVLRQQEEQKRTWRPTAMQMRQESLKALENPQELLESYRQEHEERKQQQTEDRKRLEELLPEQTRRIYEQLEQYQNSRRQAGGPADMTENNIGLLLHDINQIEHENHTEQQIFQEDREQLRQVSETVIEKWEERQEAEAKTQRRVETERNDLSLVHKSLENQIDEEFLQQLMEQNRTLSSKVQVTERQEEEKQIVRTTVHQQAQQTLVKETGDLTELIQKGVQKQIGIISDQIYTKLEKRLQNEKKRRGY